MQAGIIQAATNYVCQSFDLAFFRRGSGALRSFILSNGLLNHRMLGHGIRIVILKGQIENRAVKFLYKKINILRLLVTVPASVPFYSIILLKTISSL